MCNDLVYLNIDAESPPPPPPLPLEKQKQSKNKRKIMPPHQIYTLDSYF